MINNPKHHDTGRRVRHRAVWELDEDLLWATQDGVVHVIGKGFCSDGWSVPWIFRWFVRKVFSSRSASFIHDYLYQRGEPGWARRECDRVLLDCALWCGLDPDASFKAWKAVRRFGWIAWLRRSALVRAEGRIEGKIDLARTGDGE